MCFVSCALLFNSSHRRAGEQSGVPPGVQAAECVQHPAGGQLLHGLQCVQLARPPQAPPADAHLQHQDGGRQVCPERTKSIKCIMLYVVYNHGIYIIMVHDNTCIIMISSSLNVVHDTGTSGFIF